MGLLVEKFNKFYSKLENFPHHREDCDDAEALSAALKVFRSKVSNSLIETLLKPKPRSGNLSFSWIKRCLELLSVTDKAFAKLLVEIDHPMSKWEAASVEEYLNYTLNMLDLINLISSSISQLSHARLELYHALIASKNLPENLIKIPAVDVRTRAKKLGSDPKRFGSKKETVIREALVELTNVGFWVCGVVLSALVGNSRPYMEIKKLASGFSGSSLACLNLGGFEERVAVEEVEDVKAAVAAAEARNRKLSGDETAERLKRKLEEVEKGTEEIGELVDEIFSRTLAGRNWLLGTIKLA